MPYCSVFVQTQSLACDRSCWSSSQALQCKGFLVVIPRPQLSQQCNVASSDPWTCGGTSPTLVVSQETVWTFSKTYLKKQPLPWLFFIWRLEWLSFQWTIIGFSTVGLKLWSFKKQIRKSLLSRIELLETREWTETHIGKSFKISHLQERVVISVRPDSGKGPSANSVCVHECLHMGCLFWARNIYCCLFQSLR